MRIRAIVEWKGVGAALLLASAGQSATARADETPAGTKADSTSLPGSSSKAPVELLEPFKFTEIAEVYGTGVTTITRSLHGFNAAVASHYTVGKESDIVIRFDRKAIVDDFSGRISVRARILRAAPVELPVENFSIINEKDLQQDQMIVMPKNRSFARDNKDYRNLQDKLTDLTRQGFLFQNKASNVLSGLKVLYKSELRWAPSESDSDDKSVVTWDQVQTYAKPFPIFPITAQEKSLGATSGNDRRPPSENRATQADLDGLRALVSETASQIQDLDASRQLLMKETEVLRTYLQVVFSDPSMMKLISDDGYKRMQRKMSLTSNNIAQVVVPLQTGYGALTGAAEICAKPQRANVYKGEGAKIYSSPSLDESSLVRDGKAPRVLPAGSIVSIRTVGDSYYELGSPFPPGSFVAIADLYLDSWPLREEANCLMESVSKFAAVLRRQVSLVSSMLPRVKTAEDYCTNVSTVALDKGVGPSPADIALDKMRLTCAIEEMVQDLSGELRTAYNNRIREGRVSLAGAKLEHGEYVEIIVTSTTDALDFISKTGNTTSQAPDRTSSRFVLRVIDEGFSFKVHPQFVLVRRLSDVRVPRGDELPSNFEVAPGAAVSMRWRNRSIYSEWLIPSLGFAATIPNFSSSKSFELGVGPIFGIANDMLHFGGGWNLTVRERKSYVFISLDFLQVFNTFGQLFASTPSGGN